jgi:hypothetical protein
MSEWPERWTKGNRVYCNRAIVMAEYIEQCGSDDANWARHVGSATGFTKVLNIVNAKRKERGDRATRKQKVRGCS